jgi:polysaccharide export outer membrane protein
MSGEQRLHTLGWGLLICSLLMMLGCASNFSDDVHLKAAPSSPQSGEPMTIALGEIETTEAGLQVVVTGPQPFSYTLANHDHPLHLTVDIPQARIDRPEVRTVDHNGVKTVRLSQVPGSNGPVRLEVHLEDTAVYSVAKDQERLFVRVHPESPSPATPPTQRLAALTTVAPSVTRPSDMTPPESPATSEYRVGPGDILSITVYDEPDLTQTVRVTERGMMAFPLVGSVHVQDLTATQVAKRLEETLSPRFLINPQVFVNVAEFASKKVFIVGAVPKPTTLMLRGETTLLEVLSHTSDASLNGVFNLSHSSSLTVFRRETQAGAQRGDTPHAVRTIRVDLDRLLRQGDMSRNLVLQPHDVIYIPEPDAVFIFGEVNRTGPIPLPDGGMRLIEAINKAGGFSDFAAANRTRVLRMVDGSEQVIRVDMAAVIRGDLSQDITLKANDIVIVPESVF